MTRKTPRERFFGFVDKSSSNGCWEWRGSLFAAGYGQFSFQRYPWYTHILSYLVHVGPIAEGLEIDHLCRNRACCNPAHLEAVTHAVNSQRGHTGRHNLLKTHCKNGHEYTPDNTVRWLETNTLGGPGGRRCHQCEVDRVARRRKERQEARRSR